MLLVDAHCRVVYDMVTHAFRIQAFEFRLSDGSRMVRRNANRGGRFGCPTGLWACWSQR